MTTSPVDRRRPGLAAAALALIVSSWAGALWSLAVAGYACWVFASDVSTSGGPGLGLFIGGLLLLGATLLGVLSGAIARGATRGLRALQEDGHRGALTPTALTATVAGWLVTVYVTAATDPDATFLPVRIVATAVALSGTLTLALSLASPHRIVD